MEELSAGIANKSRLESIRTGPSGDAFADNGQDASISERRLPSSQEQMNIGGKAFRGSEQIVPTRPIQVVRSCRLQLLFATRSLLVLCTCEPDARRRVPKAPENTVWSDRQPSETLSSR